MLFYILKYFKYIIYPLYLSSVGLILTSMFDVNVLCKKWHLFKNLTNHGFKLFLDICDDAYQM